MILLTLLFLPHCLLASLSSTNPDPSSVAYLAFRIRDPKLSERVKHLHEAARNVSKDFLPFFTNPNELVQPLLTFYLEEDEVNRTSEIYDRHLQRTLCDYLPRRIPYTEFKTVIPREYHSAIIALPQVDAWLKRVKVAFVRALNRAGFINPGETEEHMIIATEPKGIPVTHRTFEIGADSMKLAASAYVDRFYICRGRAPNQYFAPPCDVVYESPVIECDKMDERQTTSPPPTEDNDQRLESDMVAVLLTAEVLGTPEQIAVSTPPTTTERPKQTEVATPSAPADLPKPDKTTSFFKIE